MRSIAPALLLVTGLATATPSHAIDGYFADVGVDGGLHSFQLGMIRQWHEHWLEDGSWHVTGYWEAALAYVHSDRANGHSLFDASLTPVFRFRPDASGGVQPYMDFGVGLHLVSRLNLDDEHRLGSALEFGPLLGLGVTFGGKSQYDLGYRFQHVSNGGIAQPNDGFNLHEIRLTYLY